MSSSNGTSAGTVTAWPLPDLGIVVPPGEDPAEPAGPSAEELAFERGIIEGRRIAAGEESARMDNAHAALRDTMNRLDAVTEEVHRTAEGNLYALAMAVARQVIMREVTTDPLIIRDLVRAALEAAPITGPIQVHLHPDDLAALAPELDGLANSPGTAPRVQWCPDPAIESGGCLVEGQQRIVDGRVDQTLRELYRVLEGA